MALFKNAHRVGKGLGSRRGVVATTAVLTALLAACGSDAKPASDATASSTTSAPDAPGVASSAAEPPSTTADVDHPMGGAAMATADRAAAMLATAGFQDVETAEAAGYASTLDGLGCFENPEQGGMGVHYLNEKLMDASVDITTPEALVYELDADGKIAGLVAHEYIVPVDAWTSTEPPSLFGMAFHQHPVLPLWVLHTWLWKDNPTGVFQDWNPATRLCPDDVPIFDAATGAAGDPHK